jgi:hypothetical protein
MKRQLWILVALMFVVMVCVAATTVVNLTTQVTGTLPVANGGTNNATVGTNGQVLISNGTNGFAPGDPRVTQNTACGLTVLSQAWAAVPSTNTAVTATTTCVLEMAFTNTTASVATITVTDGQGSPVTVISAFPIQPGATLVFQFNGMAMTSGINWQAGTASAINGAVIGYQ